MKILLVGAGGYGTLYAKALLESKRSDLSWVGVVDPFFDACSEKEAILAARIPVYDTMDAFYREQTADLAVISTPPFLHREQALCALSHNSYVLCEKPVAPTLAEAKEMLAAEDTYKKFIAIGYQWSFSHAIRQLKQDVLDGVLGKPISMKTMICWPRNFAYYRRGGGWGGKLFKGTLPVYDSILSNACAHYFHNMLFLLGDTLTESAPVTSLFADCLRANDIETFDTCTVRATAKGIPLLFVASHATKTVLNPVFSYVFEKATVTFSEDEDSIIHAHFSDGSTKTYGNPFDGVMNKLWESVAAIQNGTVPICTVKTAMEHTAMIGMLHDTVTPRPFEKERIRLLADGSGVYVEGLYEELCRAYEGEKLLSDG